jgi:hypothetical protein
VLCVVPIRHQNDLVNISVCCYNFLTLIAFDRLHFAPHNDIKPGRGKLTYVTFAEQYEARRDRGISQVGRI